MPPKRKRNDLIIKIKRASLFLLCLSFFFIPGQNWYEVLQTRPYLGQNNSFDLLLPNLADYPVKTNDLPFPDLTAKSIVALDRDSSVLIYGSDEKIRLFPASTVKIMTALVALDYYGLDDVITIGKVDDNGQDMELQEEEQITVRNLLYGVLVASANDAAMALADGYSGGERKFVEAMNQKAYDLNLNDTFFANPTGLDSDEQGNLLPNYSYSTALDLARLAAVALKNPEIAGIVSLSFIQVKDVSGQIVHDLYTINELLNQLPGMKGLKTGWTEEAGECLVGYTERDGRGLITVVLGSQDRFGETKTLVEWVFKTHQWQKVTPSI